MSLFLQGLARTATLITSGTLRCHFGQSSRFEHFPCTDFHMEPNEELGIERNSLTISSPTEDARRSRQKWSLTLFYTGHFLFTWNDRMWEFAAVIFLVAAYPATLRPSSIFGLASTASAIVFGPSIGHWFDITPRLKSVRCAIFAQRFVVSGGCVCLWAMITQNLRTNAKDGLFAVAIVLGCIGKLAFVGKTVGIERDWVCRPPSTLTKGDRDQPIPEH